LDIVEAPDGTISGNMIIDSVGTASCLSNGLVSGTNNGFNFNLTASGSIGFLVTTVETRVIDRDESGNPIDPEVTTRDRISATRIQSSRMDDGRGNTAVVTVSDDPVTGDISFQFSVTNGGNTISGNYVAPDNVCSDGTGNGEATLNRS